ncbi:MAG TPA: type II secretion system secretin GspD [Phycisphaerae bacterium]|nr:type II secretion system secretin GspD [Phycisphaerae bacterium]
MIQTPYPSGVAGGRRRGRVAPRPGRLACAALMILWLMALLVAAAAVAGEAPPSTEEAPPKAPADTDPGSQPEAAPKPDQEPMADPETDPESKPKPEAPPEDEPGAEARKKDEPEPEDRPRPKPGEPLRLNFKDASLHAVLEYLSEAAGLIIVEEAEVEGRVTVMSLQPISTDEAIALLDTVLKEEGYAAVRNGRTLKIVSLARAAKENIPTFSGGDPDQIPRADRLVTQIIPVRFADATRLKTDLAPLLSSTATLSTNAASNALVLVDTQANIRRMAEIIQALDSQISGVSEVKVFQLEYANATNAARLITELFRQEDQGGAQSSRSFFPFFGRGGSDRGDDRSRSRDESSGREQKVVASADDRTNTLVVSAPPDLLKVIEGIIEELDSNPSEEESFFIYPLKNADAKNLEAVLNQAFSEVTPTSRTTGTTTSTQGRSGFSPFSRTSSGSSQRVAASAGDLVGQVYVVADEDTNSLIVRAASKHFDRINELLVELDRATPQVLIKVLIAEITHEDTLDLGTEFSVLNLQFGVNVEATGDLGGTDERPGGLVTATMTGGLAASFNALQAEGRLDVLSRPYILASDNREASITVGQEVPFITNSRTTETGQTINTIEYQDIGIILNVTPHINPQGLVIMEVAPEISHLLEDTTVPLSETVNATVYAKRSAQTEVAIRDGQTIVIGGLMEDRINDTVRKVPILGDIPLLGALFQRIVKTKVKTELLIFLTPHVARDPDDLRPMSEDEMAGSKAGRQGPQSQAFEEHLEGLQRGAAPAPQPQEDKRDALP